MSKPSCAESSACGEPELLHRFFERIARAQPNAVALEVPPGPGRPAREQVTYGELDRESDALARRLGQLVRGECVVALLVPRESPRLFAAELAVLKSGAAYVCLESGFPDPHARYVLEDCAAVAVLTDAAGRARALEWNVPPERILDVDELLRAEPNGSEPLAPPAWLTPESLAYVIYTSGTTGTPKGVLIEHRSIANLVASDLETYGVSPADRVAQNSSHAYDSSLEETWLALAAGASLVVADDATVRLGPDLVAWLASERVTVFCPPPTLLRATGCADPLAALPELRFLYVGGEPLGEDLAERWGRGRWLENGYGPTECTVTVVRGRVRPGEPVTLGKPVRGHSAWILDEALEPVEEGQPGELCISGVGLARGYLGKPKLTHQQFQRHPRFGRIYRTGDRVRRDERGELVYLGRIDSQVKVRGHRVELTAIESKLAAAPGVRAAAARLQPEGMAGVLVAFVVPERASEPPDPERLRALLGEQLPEAAVPARIAVLESLPTTLGGKLDRARLPRLEAASNGRHVAPPRDELEERIAACWRTALEASQVPGIDQDFFVDLGGDSLRAALLVSLLREHPSTAALTVRDVYAGRTVAALAESARRAGRLELAPIAEPQRERGNPELATCAHALALAFELVATSALACWIVLELVPAALAALGLTACVLLAPVALALVPLATAWPAVAAAVAAKRALIGRYRPMRAPAWGSFHVRNWLVQRVARAIPWGLLQDTELTASVLRALGAKVGKRLHVHRGVDLARGGWDLLEIGDDVTLAQDAALRLVELEAGEVVLAPVTLGSGSTVDVRAGVSGGASLGADAYLSPLSWLPAGVRVPAGELWDGVPAARVGEAPRAPAHGEREMAPALHSALLIGMRVLSGAVRWLPAAALLAAIAAIAGIDATRVQAWVRSPSADPLALAAALAMACLAVPASLLFEGSLARLLGRVRPGVIARTSLAYVRVGLKTDIARFAGVWLSGTLMWPGWLRLAGMSVGRKSEISTLIDTLPELVSIGDETFLADGIYLGGPRLQRGSVTLAHSRLGDNVFVGNHALIPAGVDLPDGALLGLSTVADAAQMRPESAWFGHPPFELARRAESGYDRSFTHEPGFARWLSRLLWEVARFVLPIPPLLIAFGWLRALAAAASTSSAASFYLLWAPLATLGSAAAACLFVLALKWALLGRVRPGEHPLWSCWCSRWDFLYVAWGFIARPWLSALEGTLLIAWYLRAMGARIGRRALLGSGFAQVVDPDMLELGDDATVGGLFQAHTFEERVLKIDRVAIRAAATVGSSAVLFYGSEIGAGARVAPHGVVMKRERLAPGRRYAGAPTRAVAAAPAQPSASSAFSIAPRSSPLSGVTLEPK
jgi:non-ribosomal peptide synthetase-like protein